VTIKTPIPPKRNRLIGLSRTAFRGGSGCGVGQDPSPLLDAQRRRGPTGSPGSRGRRALRRASSRRRRPSGGWRSRRAGASPRGCPRAARSRTRPVARRRGGPERSAA
jgi:hypothetical protein